MKRIMFVTGTEETKQTLLSQLENIFEGMVRVKGYAVDEEVLPQLNGEVVLFSSHMMWEECEEQLGGNCTILIAKRTVNFNYMDRIFNIQEGESVLYVNDRLEAAVEAVETLQMLGINHLHYKPYGPGEEVDTTLEIAITPGEQNHVPKSISTIVDIGSRLIDLSTILELCIVFSLSERDVQIVTKRYQRDMIQLSKRIARMNQTTTQLNNSLHRIVDGVNEGVLSYTDKHIVTLFNEELENLTNISNRHAVGKALSTIFPQQELLHFLTSHSEEHTSTLSLFQQEIHLNRFYISATKTWVCTFVNLTKQKEHEKKRLRELKQKGYVAKYTFDRIVGQSEEIIETKRVASRLSKTDFPILIHGETGTGKELFASAIHCASERKEQPFLAINCSALTEDLLESELFGYEEGAFTGAKKGGRKGVFEQADGGTLFMDEIGDISLKLQARLLRVLQEGEVRRIGGEKNIPINVRIVSATNADLKEKVMKGEFREDLYFRLKVLYLQLPPLRARTGDISLLIAHILREMNVSVEKISEPLMDALIHEQWSGNVRELRNILSYLVAVGDEIWTVHDLPSDYHRVEQEVIWSKEMEEIATVLYEWNEKGEGASRQKLVERLPHLTEQQIRSRLKKLEREGVVDVAKGRRGTILTDFGRRQIEKVKDFL